MHPIDMEIKRRLELEKQKRMMKEQLEQEKKKNQKCKMKRCCVIL